MLVTSRLIPAGNSFLDQPQTLCDPVAPRDTILFVPILDGKPHAVVMICIRSHLRRVFPLLADRRDRLLAVAPIRSVFSVIGQLTSLSMNVELITSAVCRIGQERWSRGVF